MPSRRTDEGFIIEVLVTPRSSKAEVVGVVEKSLKVKLTAPPVEGAANEQLIGLLARHFGVRRQDISILKGEASRRKRVKIAKKEGVGWSRA